jgi:restriction endonuclease S subunit
MSYWPARPLGELCDVKIGRTPRRDEPRFWGGNAVWVTIRDLADGEISSSKESVSEIAVRECMPEPVPAGTLLFSFKLTIGKMAVAGCPLYTNEAIAALPIRNPEILSRDFLRYALMAESREGTADAAVLGKLLNKDKVAQLLIPVPPLEEQGRIVKLLGKVDELRKLRAHANHHTAALIPAIFHGMFGDMERNSMSWPTKTINEVCVLVRGSSPRPKSDPRYYGGPIPRLTIEDITRDGWLVTPRVDSLTELGATMSRPVKAGTIVMAVSGNVGLCSQLAVDACVHDGFVAFKDLNEKLFIPIFFGFAMSQMRAINRRNQAGAVFQNITTSDVKAMTFPVPPLSLQMEFAARVTEIREFEAQQATSSHRLDSLFQSLLHRAFMGVL